MEQGLNHGGNLSFQQMQYVNPFAGLQNSLGSMIDDRAKQAELDARIAQQEKDNIRADATLALTQARDAREVAADKGLAQYTQQLGVLGANAVPQADADAMLNAYNQSDAGKAANLGQSTAGLSDGNMQGMYNKSIDSYNKSPQARIDMLRSMAPTTGLTGRDMNMALEKAVDPLQKEVTTDVANKFQLDRDNTGYKKALELEDKGNENARVIAEMNNVAAANLYTLKQNSEPVKMSKLDPVTNTISTVDVPRGQVSAFQANGFSLGDTKPGPKPKDGAEGTDGKGTTIAKQYDTLKETIAKDYGSLDAKGALDLVDELQANGIHPDVVKDVMRKSSAGSLIDKTFTYADLNEYMPKMYDAGNNAKGYGDVLKQAKEEGKVIVLSDDKKHYSMVDKTKAKVDENKVTNTNTTAPVVEKPKEPVAVDTLVKAKETQIKMQGLYDAANTQEEKNAILKDSDAIQRAAAIKASNNLGPMTETNKAMWLNIGNAINNGVVSIAEVIKGDPEKERTIKQMMLNVGTQYKNDSQYIQKSPTGNPTAHITYK